MEELFEESTVNPGARIKFLALGSAACRALNYFFSQNTYITDLCLAVDTDLRCLESLSSNLPKYCFAKNILRGFSSGGDETLIKESFAKEDNFVENFCQKLDVLVLLVGLSGGSGCGMLNATVQKAIQTGAFVLVIPIIPFSFEGKNKGIRAQIQLKTLHSLADLVVPFYNDILFQTLPNTATIKEAFAAGNHLLSQLLQSFFSSLTQTETGAFSCNLNDFIKHFSGKPDAVCWGYGEGKGEKAVEVALQSAMNCPALKVHVENIPSQHAFVYTNLSHDIALTELKNLNYELQSFLGIPDLTLLNVCHSHLSGEKEAKIFILLSYSKMNLKTVRYRSKKQTSSEQNHVQIQFDFEGQGIESFWDTPTYLRLGLKLEP